VSLTIAGEEPQGVLGAGAQPAPGLTLAALGSTAPGAATGLALLDDLDSELDQERAAAVCRFVVERGQALVTTAHEPWAQSLREMGRLFEVCDGRVRAA
jgi:recombinational DNA repair ATPase RecF